MMDLGIASGAGAPNRLAEIALALANAIALEDVCRALEGGRLRRDSTSAVRAGIAGGSSAIEVHLRALQSLWDLEARNLSPAALALALRTSAATAAECYRQQTCTQVVWTGPKVGGSFLRSTREVVREILRGSDRNLLVIGYWIAARDDREGIIEEFISALGDAVNRGVHVRVIVDGRGRKDGRDNLQVLKEVWPPGIVFPKVYTWRTFAVDRYLKLHAKVLVADGHDALITSANLTSYAMDRNMEVGVRVTGAPAASIVDHFQRLIDVEILEDFQRT